MVAILRAKVRRAKCGLPRDSTVLGAHSPPNGIKDTHPRTKASEEPKSHHQKGIWLRRFSTRRLSCLLFQMFCVETSSFLPNQQSDGCDLRAKVRRAKCGFM